MLCGQFAGTSLRWLSRRRREGRLRITLWHRRGSDRSLPKRRETAAASNLRMRLCQQDAECGVTGRLQLIVCSSTNAPVLFIYGRKIGGTRSVAKPPSLVPPYTTVGRWEQSKPSLFMSVSSWLIDERDLCYHDWSRWNVSRRMWLGGASSKTVGGAPC